MKRFLLVLIVLGMIAGAVYMTTANRGILVDGALVKQGTIREYVEERAKTRLPDIVRITMPLQGRIRPITLREGDQVTKGQVVAQLDQADLHTDLTEAGNSVEQYTKSVEQIDLAIEQANQTVSASRSRYEFAETEFGRTTAAFRKNAVSDVERQKAEMDMIDARVGLRKDELQASMYQIGRRVMELMRETELSKEAKIKRDLSRTDIATPISGQVLSRAETNERVLQAGAVLLEIGDLSQLEIEADVLTEDALKITLQAPVEIEAADFGDRPVKGQVTRIYPQGFTKVSSLGVEQQRVKVVIGFAPGELERLVSEGRRPGVDYRVRVRIFTAERPGATIVPRGALFRGADGVWQTFVIRNQRAKLVAVATGIRNDYEAEVTQGVQPGEVVVLAPDSSLTDGSPVELINPPKLDPPETSPQSESAPK